MQTQVRKQPPTLRRYLIPIGLLALMLALLGGSGLAEGKKKAKKTTLSISLPASVKAGKSFTIKAKGYSGKFDTVAFHAFFGGKCQSNELSTEVLGSAGGRQTVKTKHDFHVKLKFSAANPGTHHACVYLYKAGKPGGSQLHKSKTYKVVS